MLSRLTTESLRKEIRALKLMLLLSLCLPYLLAFQASTAATQPFGKLETRELVVSNAQGRQVFRVYVNEIGDTEIQGSSGDSRSRWNVHLRPQVDPEPSKASESMSADTNSTASGVGTFIAGQSKTSLGRIKWGMGNGPNGIHFDTGDKIPCPNGKYQLTAPSLGVDFAGGTGTIASWSTPNWPVKGCS